MKNTNDGKLVASKVSVKLKDLINAHSTGRREIFGFPLSAFRNSEGYSFDGGWQDLTQEQLRTVLEDDYTATGPIE